MDQVSVLASVAGREIDGAGRRVAVVSAPSIQTHPAILHRFARAGA